MSAKHTPLPWKAERTNWKGEPSPHHVYISGGEYQDIDDEGEPRVTAVAVGIAIVQGNATSHGVTEANADLIVRAVNSHADLLAAADFAEIALRVVMDEYGGKIEPSTAKVVGDGLRAAIAKATASPDLPARPETIPDRIDPADARALFDRVGLKPLAGGFSAISGAAEDRGDIVLALAIDSGDNSADRAEAFAAARLPGLQAIAVLARLAGLEFQYANGLALGWDRAGRGEPATPPSLSPDAAAGFADGHAAYLAAVCDERP